MQNSYSNQIEKNINAQTTYAGFWTRLAAYIIDSILIFTGLLIIRIMMSGIMMLLSNTPFGGNILFHYTLKDIVLYVGQALYFILCTYFTGTTVGKRAMNLRVISKNDNEKLTFLTVMYRETVGRFLSAFLLCIGYIMIGIDKEKRGLHDFLCDTRVIYAKKVKVYQIYQRPQAPYAAYNHNVATVPPGVCEPPSASVQEEMNRSENGYSYQEAPEDTGTL